MSQELQPNIVCTSSYRIKEACDCIVPDSEEPLLLSQINLIKVLLLENKLNTFLSIDQEQTEAACLASFGITSDFVTARVADSRSSVGVMRSRLLPTEGEIGEERGEVILLRRRLLRRVTAAIGSAFVFHRVLIE